MGLEPGATSVPGKLPTAVPRDQGHKPGRGAQVDEDLQKEDIETVERK